MCLVSACTSQTHFMLRRKSQTKSEVSWSSIANFPRLSGKMCRIEMEDYCSRAPTFALIFYFLDAHSDILAVSKSNQGD